MHWVGFDVGKAFHWVCVLDGEGEVVLSRKVEATEERMEETLSEILDLGETNERVVGIDILEGRPPCSRRCCWSAGSEYATFPAPP